MAQRMTQENWKRLAAAGLIFATPAVLSAQDDGGLSATAGLSQRLYADDTSTYAATGLSFGLASETRNTRLALDLSGRIVEAFDDGVTTEFDSPRIALSYSTESRQSLLSFEASYFRDEVTSDIALGDDPGFAEIDDGDVEVTRAALSYSFGREARFGGTITLSHVDTDYFDTTDPDLIDNLLQSGSVTLRFEIDPRITATLDASLSELDRDGGTDLRTERIGAGVELAVNPNLTVGARIGRTRITESGDVPTSATEGLSYGLDLTQALPNGTLSASLVSDIDEDGRATTVRVDRELALPAGALTAGIGASRSDVDGSWRPLYTLGYTQELARGAFSATLEQDSAVNDDGDRAINTRARVDLSQELTARTDLTASLAYSASNFVTGASADSSVYGVTLAVSHALNSRWDLVGGYSFTRERESGLPDDDTNEVFIGIETTFGWRP